MTNANFVDLLEESCQANKSKLAMIDEAGNRLTFEHIFFAVQSLSQALLDRGVARGDFVANRFKHPAIATVMNIALMKVGANPVLGWGVPNATVSQNPVRYFIVPPDSEDTGTRILKFDQSWLAPAMGYVTTRAPGVVICSSSGTTGEPKLQSVDHNVIRARVASEFERRVEPAGGALLGYSYRTFFGFTLQMAMLSAGCAQVFTGSKPSSVIADCIAANVSRAYITPPLIRWLVEAYERGDGAFDRLKLQEIHVGGSATSYELARKAEEAFNCSVYVGYGTSETGGIAFCEAEPPSGEGQKVGKVAAGFEVKFIGDKEVENAPEVGGELLIWVPEKLRKSAYLNAEGPYFDGGWVRTGDLARMDNEGNLILTGRVHSLINFGGTKRTSEQFESVMSRSEFVTDVAAVGIPNENGYDDVCLLVVAANDQQKRAVMDHVRKAIVPISRGTNVKVFWRDSLPFIENGKHDRRDVMQIARTTLPDEILIAL